MDWNNRIQNAILIYKGSSEEDGISTWSLKRTACRVRYYISKDLSEFDQIICTILEKSGGVMEESQLAAILGFNIANDFVHEPKRYEDPGEKELLDSTLKPIINDELIIREENVLRLTKLGARAIARGEKYEFLEAEIDYLDHLNFSSGSQETLQNFPFYQELGVKSELRNSKRIKYYTDENNVNQLAFSTQFADLESCLRLQQGTDANIYFGVFIADGRYLSIHSVKVCISVYKDAEGYFPVVFNNNHLSEIATQLLNDNPLERDKKIEWGQYLSIINDSSAILNAETILPFEDLLQWDSLIKDKRLCWGDSVLFEYMIQKVDVKYWHAISLICPLEIVYRHLSDASSLWDWSILSSRVEDDYLLKHAEDYPWDFELISQKKDIEIDVLKALLLMPSLAGKEWDWDAIMPQLDDEFIIEHIDDVDFDLSESTKRYEFAGDLLIAHIDKRWSWRYVTENYPLQFLYEHLIEISSKLDLHSFIPRVFEDEAYSDLFAESDSLLEAVQSQKHLTLNDFTANGRNFHWSDKVIEFCTKTNLISWESGFYTIGFECNPYLKWDETFFQRYSIFVSTLKGYKHLSEVVTDLSIIKNNKDYKWDWTSLSYRNDVLNDFGFISEFISNLNVRVLLDKLVTPILERVLDIPFVVSFIKDNVDVWECLTKKVSIEYVRQHIDNKWNWSVLTQRFYKTINLTSIGSPKWVDKWDWYFLTKNLPEDFVLANLDLYIDRWDWTYLSKTLDKQFIIQNLLDYIDHWDWSILVSEKLDKEDLKVNSWLPTVATCISIMPDERRQTLWSIITRRFELDELIWMIDMPYSNLFAWDFEYFYNLPSFPAFDYLENHTDVINWTSFSSSKAAQSIFAHDKSLFSHDRWTKDVVNILTCEDYLWNFKSLSKLDSINWNTAFLKIYPDQWDWSYLSENSGCFKKSKDIARYIDMFSEYLDFNTFSRRQNTSIPQSVLIDYLDKPWDWKALSVNRAAEIDFEFIKEHLDKPWDFAAISGRLDITFDNESFIESVKSGIESWDWAAISNRRDLVFDSDLIDAISKYPLDWFMITSQSSFEPSARLLSKLSIHKLNWASISSNPKLDKSVLWDYRDKLDWNSVTRTSFDISNVKSMDKLKEYLDWQYISQSPSFKLTVNLLVRFKDYLNWRIVNCRSDFEITNEILDNLSEYVDWDKASASNFIDFSNELIERYHDKWNWAILVDNAHIIEHYDEFMAPYKKELNCAKFVRRLGCHQYVYHFTHMFNALDIIRNKKIQSRNIASSHFANAAGLLVDRRNTAHDYARFYYVTGTPTQFYNECLGKDSETGEWGWVCRGYYYDDYGRCKKDWEKCWKSYYSQARNLGLPKCPMPVFFRFDLSEILREYPDISYYSTGNMQTNWAQVLKVEDNPDRLVPDFDSKETKQQEFLVLNELDFSRLHNYEIYCYDSQQAMILRSLLAGDPIAEKIHCDGDVYIRKNKQLAFDVDDTMFSVSSDYHGEAYLSLRCDKIASLSLMNPKDIKKETYNEIQLYPSVRVKLEDVSFQVYFVDTEFGKREWLIYDYTPTAKSFEWDSLSLAWKVTLYKNLLLAEKFGKQMTVNALCDDSYGIDGLLTFRESADNAESSIEELNRRVESHIKHLSETEVESILNLEYVYIEERVESLKPLKFLKNLKVVKFANQKYDFIDFTPLAGRNIHVIDRDDYCQYTFESYTNISECDSIYYNGLDSLSLYKMIYGDVFGPVFYGSEYSPLKLQRVLSECLPELEELYDTQIRHYKLSRHTQLVCEQFEKYPFDMEKYDVDNNLLRTVLALHDVGKAIDRDQQHVYTLKLVEKVWPKLPFSASDFSLVKVLLKDDNFGLYMQNKYSQDDMFDNIQADAATLGMKPRSLLWLKMVLYQCDTASYTADAGGLKYLEGMFEYTNSGKVFNNTLGILQFSQVYMDRFNELNDRI